MGRSSLGQCTEAAPDAACRTTTSGSVRPLPIRSPAATTPASSQARACSSRGFHAAASMPAPFTTRRNRPPDVVGADLGSPLPMRTRLCHNRLSAAVSPRDQERAPTRRRERVPVALPARWPAVARSVVRERQAQRATRTPAQRSTAWRRRLTDRRRRHAGRAVALRSGRPRCPTSAHPSVVADVDRVTCWSPPRDAAEEAEEVVAVEGQLRTLGVLAVADADHCGQLRHFNAVVAIGLTEAGLAPVTNLDTVVVVRLAEAGFTPCPASFRLSPPSCRSLSFRCVRCVRLTTTAPSHAGNGRVCSGPRAWTRWCSHSALNWLEFFSSWRMSPPSYFSTYVTCTAGSVSNLKMTYASSWPG